MVVVVVVVVAAAAAAAVFCFLVLNPFTLKSSSRNIVCYFHTFENNLGMKLNFTKYLKDICCMFSDQHFSFKCFQKKAFVREIFPKSSGLIWPL